MVLAPRVLFVSKIFVSKVWYASMAAAEAEIAAYAFQTHLFAGVCSTRLVLRGPGASEALERLRSEGVLEFIAETLQTAAELEAPPLPPPFPPPQEDSEPDLAGEEAGSQVADSVSRARERARAARQRPLPGSFAAGPTAVPDDVAQLSTALTLRIGGGPAARIAAAYQSGRAARLAYSRGDDYVHAKLAGVRSHAYIVYGYADGLPRLTSSRRRLLAELAVLDGVGYSADCGTITEARAFGRGLGFPDHPIGLD